MPVRASSHMPLLRAAEFFAGIGLVRLGIEDVAEVVWANDISESKARVYEENFGKGILDVRDIREVRGDDVPDVDLATASFPCTDLSLAGPRRGLDGEESGLFWEFARVLEEMGERRPWLLLIENVPGFATSNRGEDLKWALDRLRRLGYVSDVFLLDASRFVPQSRLRLFIACSSVRVAPPPASPDELRPEWVVSLAGTPGGAAMQALPLEPPRPVCAGLEAIVERLDDEDPAWWDEERVASMVRSLSDRQRTRLDELVNADRVSWRTAYRRTRRGRAVWEIRSDGIAGCLRTTRGGSSKQALVEAGRGEVKARWLTAREYARLQGVPDDFKIAGVSENQARFAFGDGVCVPAVSWIARNWISQARDSILDGSLEAVG